MGKLYILFRGQISIMFLLTYPNGDFFFLKKRKSFLRLSFELRQIG